MTVSEELLFSEDEFWQVQDTLDNQVKVTKLIPFIKKHNQKTKWG